MYTVVINGVPIQCETAAAAIELTRQAAANGVDSAKPASPTGEPVPGSRWTAQRVRDFFTTISGSQRKLIDALLEAEDAKTDDQLCKVIDMKDSMALGGVLTPLLKNAKKVGADSKDLYQRNDIMLDGKRHYEFSLTPSFRGAALKWKP